MKSTLSAAESIKHNAMRLAWLKCSKDRFFTGRTAFVDPQAKIMKKKILVTGGAGFLGSHLCDKLLAKGEDVLCVDNFLPAIRPTLHICYQIHFLSFYGTMLRSHSTSRLMRSTILPAQHHRSITSMIRCKRPRRASMARSICWDSLNALARILQASTSEVYGDPEVHPQKEDYWGRVIPIGIRSCYDEGKRCAETLFFDYWRQHKLRIKVVRIFNTYGPRMHPGDGRVVSNFIVQALRGDDITIYGNGQQSRSFCYVDDMVDALVLMMLSADEFTGPVNVGNPTEFTMLELAERVLCLTGSRSRVVYRPLPSDDPKQRQPDITLANQQLSWQPKVSLEDGLKKTIAYFKEILGK